MKIKRFFISLIVLAIFVITFISCSGTKDICPAYSLNTTETSVVYGG